MPYISEKHFDTIPTIHTKNIQSNRPDFDRYKTFSLDELEKINAQTISQHQATKQEERTTNKEIIDYGFDLEYLENFSKESNNNVMNAIVNQSANEQTTMAMRIMLEQLKHQFPGNEFDANKMVESLMGIMQIAQNSELNDTQKKHLSLLQASINTQFSDLQGKIIEHRGDTFDYQGEDQEILFPLWSDGQKAKLSIHDEQGNPIFDTAISGRRGTNLFSWNGQNNSNGESIEGVYRVSVQVEDQPETSMKPYIRLKSKVTDVVFGENILPIPLSGSIPIHNLNSVTHLKTRQGMDQKKVTSVVGGEE